MQSQDNILVLNVLHNKLIKAHTQNKYQYNRILTLVPLCEYTLICNLLICSLLCSSAITPLLELSMMATVVLAIFFLEPVILF